MSYRSTWFLLAARRLCFLFAIASASTASAQSVVVVDSNGGGDHTDLPAAVAVATEGSVLLVRQGEYSGFELVDKGLSIVADLNHVVRVGTSRVRDTTREKRVLLSGLQFVRPHTQAQTRPSLELIDNDGLVFLQRLLIRAPDADPAIFSSGLRVENCSGVTVVHSLVFGSRGFQGSVGNPPFTKHEAISMVDSDLALWDVFARGGVGADGNFNLLLPDTFLPGTRGGHGLDQTGGFVFASGCALLGGRGGDGDLSLAHLSCLGGYDGGDGVHSSSGDIVTLDSTLDGGAGGATGGNLCTDGVDGEAIEKAAGTHTPLVSTASELFADSPIREGDTAFFIVEGEPGGFAFLAISASTTHFYTPLFSGTLGLIPSNSQVIALGALPANGQAVHAATVPDLGIGVEAGILTAQGAVLANGIRLTSPARVVLLDGAL